MLTLFHAPRSRSSRFIWLLEELETPYTIALTSIVRRDGGAPAPESYRKFHPHLKVPAIDHDGEIVFESSAVVLYRSEEHTSELQSLMRISYAVFCLKKKKHHQSHNLYKTLQIQFRQSITHI